MHAQIRRSRRHAVYILQALLSSEMQQHPVQAQLESNRRGDTSFSSGSSQQVYFTCIMYLSRMCACSHYSCKTPQNMHHSHTHARARTCMLAHTKNLNATSCRHVHRPHVCAHTHTESRLLEHMQGAKDAADYLDFCSTYRGCHGSAYGQTGEGIGQRCMFKNKSQATIR